MGITKEELAETIHLVASVGLGSIVAAADRCSKKVFSSGENSLSVLLR
jgi:alkylhydroperoxidase/carboxymuconolactone decarboxylase family protein YurZ